MKQQVKEKHTSNKKIQRMERDSKRRKKRISRDELFEMRWK
jgi:hypothetical protein